MIVGIDFDNTLVCYDNVFYRVALQRGIIPENIGRSKQEVSKYLQENGLSQQWTELQGIVYGPEIIQAEPYPGVLDFLKWCKKNNICVYIISHKTRHPYLGERYNLHTAAQQFLLKKSFFTEETGLSLDDVFFLETKQEKLTKIAHLECDFFIDDLPEILEAEPFADDTSPVLFDVQRNFRQNSFRTGLVIVHSWMEFKELIKVALVMQAKHVKIITGGKNNLAFRVLKNDQAYFVKSYFTHSGDPRNRLDREYSFLEFLYQNNISNIARPIKRSDEHNLGVYQYLNGHKVNGSELNQFHVEQALKFFWEINQHKHQPEAKLLPPASEACFSIQEHLDCVKERINRLKQIKDSSVSHMEALSFINNFLEPMLVLVSKNISNSFSNLSQKIQPEEICLSPSDFGFHNALVKDDQIFFTDFEYAGWDDPAKLVCDFFCQPQIRVPHFYFDEFSKRVLGKSAERAKALLPLYQLKWCCILLNEFLDLDGQRRTFSGENNDQAKQRQLKKARDYFRDAQPINKVLKNEFSVMINASSSASPLMNSSKNPSLVAPVLKAGTKVEIINPLHKSTAREYLVRMCDDKVTCMKVAKEYGREYWDGSRRYGYGGYKYLPGRWAPVAQQLINRYKLNNNSKILDVGCGKAYLLYELKQLLPECTVAGFDNSDYAIRNAKEEIKEYLFVQRADQTYTFADKEFDLVISINVLHNLKINEVKLALQELERVGKEKYLAVESYRDEQELFNLQCWALTAESFFTPEEWVWLFKEFNYSGDYEFIYFE